MNPTEVKKALRICSRDKTCVDCPYGEKFPNSDKCLHELMKDAVFLIDSLDKVTKSFLVGGDAK